MPPVKTASQKKAAEAKRKIVYNTTKEVAKREDESQFAKTFKVPEGMKVFKFKAAKRYKLRAIPHVVGNANPNCDEGLVHYELTFYTHPNLGPKNETIVCGQCFKDEEGNPKPCAVCDQMQALRRAGKSWEDIKHLASKKRQLWYFEDQEDLPAGIQVFEASYFGKGQGFGEMMRNKLDSADEESTKHNFFHLDGGSTLTVLTKEDKFQGRVFYKPTNIEMDLSKKVYPESILDKLPPLESMLVETSYDKAEALLGGSAAHEGGEGEEQEAQPEEETAEETTEVEEEVVEEEVAEEEAEVEEETTEEETQEVEIGVGSRIQYEYKGETRTGTVSKIVEDKNLLHVKVDGKDGPPSAVKMDDPTLAVIEEEEAEEEPVAEEEEVEVEEEGDGGPEEEFAEEEVEVEEEEVPEPPKKKVAAKAPPKPAAKAATPSAKKVAGKK